MCSVERGAFFKIILESEISIVSNTSIEECSDFAVLVIERIKDYDTSDSIIMTTVIGEDVVVNFTGSSDQYTCTPHIELPSGRCLSFPQVRVSIAISIINLLISSIGTI